MAKSKAAPVCVVDEWVFISPVYDFTEYQLRWSTEAPALGRDPVSYAVFAYDDETGCFERCGSYEDEDDAIRVARQKSKKVRYGRETAEAA